MQDWLDELARTLGEEPLTPDERNALLGAARDVAHRVERKITPLSTFLLGEAAGRAEAAGTGRDVALRNALDRLASLIPVQEGEERDGAPEP
ncbi:MAG: DUF6457 domain-containing protein [Actinomycetota bacterium]|nr:DUF6457 domain-containing protein [Actinomycetota bacterium]